MAANVLNIDASHDNARIGLRGDMSVLFDQAVSDSFTIRLFTTTDEVFMLESNLYQFVDTDGNLVNGFALTGKGLFVDLMFDPVNEVWYITANNIVAGEHPEGTGGEPGGGTGGEGSSFDTTERQLTFLPLPAMTPMNYATSRNWYATITANAKLANPTNMNPGDALKIIITQGPGGSKLLAFDGAYGFFEAQPGVLSTTAGAIDILDCYMTNDRTLICDLKKNYSVIRPLAYSNEQFQYNMQAAYTAAQTHLVDGQTVQVIRNGYRLECNGTIGFGLSGFNMRVRGVNQPDGKLAELRLDKLDRPSFGKALVNIEGGDNIVIENLKIAGACAYADGNGTGILINGGVDYVRVEGCWIVDNENGVRSSISTNPKYDLIDCLIEKNGQAANPAHRGYSHSIYAGEGPIWRALRVTFRDPVDGHNIKTRSERTILNQVYSRNAVGAREIDCCDQGILHATDSVFWKHAGSVQNNLIGIGHECLSGFGRQQDYFFINCYFHNDIEPSRDVTFLENMAKGANLNNVAVHFIDCEFGGAAVQGKTLAGRASMFKGPYTITLTGGPVGPRVPVGDARALFNLASRDPNRMTNPANIALTPFESLPPMVETEPTPPYPGMFIPIPVVPALPSNGAGGVSDSIAPTVSLAASNTNVTTASTMTLTATASDNIGVTRVEFYKDGVLLGTDTSAPFTHIENFVQGDSGTFQYTAKAYDAANNSKTSSAVGVFVHVPDTTAPLVTLTASQETVTVPTTLGLTATATDNIAVVNVEFFRGAQLISSDNASPYSASQELTHLDNGSLVYTVKGYDSAENVATSAQVVVVVNIPPPDVTAPTVSLASSSLNVTNEDPVTFTATTFDAVGVTRVEFFREGTIVGTADTVEPFTMQLVFSASDNGVIPFTAKAYDAANNETTSSVLNVTVNISGDSVSPTITLASSSTSVNAPGDITLTATAADANGVNKVEFFKNGVKIGSDDVVAPYVITQSLTEADNGTIVYTARAYDDAGNSTLSAAVNVVVDCPHVKPVTTLDATSQAEYDTAINAAIEGGKRMAGANALLTAFDPDHRLYIYQDGELVIPVEYTGSLTVVDDGFDIFLQPSLTIDSSDPLIAGDLAVGTWWFELKGGAGYTRVLTGTVGLDGSGADLMLSENPAPGEGFAAELKFVLPRSLDGLA